jgi:methylenetetrahydrofolate reductase (NADPH)
MPPQGHGYAARMRIDAILAAKRPVFSVEFFPPRTEEATAQLFETARSLRELEPDFVSVTYGAGGSTREGTVEITRALKDDLGLETMAHLSCVGETAEGLSATLDRIAAAGIENVFALRGDPPRGEGDFVQPEGGLGSAAELAAFIAAGWDFTVGGACFPEVHPEAPDLETDLAYLRSKVEAGASFLITQLFFDNQVYFDFVAAAREAGIEAPILAGVIPVAGFAQTKRICGLCDASIPPRLEDAFRAAGGDEGAEFELGVAYAAQQCAELLIGGAPGIHFYALNRAPATRAVLGALQASRPWERRRGPALGAPAAETN